MVKNPQSQFDSQVYLTNNQLPNLNAHFRLLFLSWAMQVCMSGLASKLPFNNAMGYVLALTL